MSGDTDEMNLNPQEGYMVMPSGCALYWKVDPAIGARVYHSDEIGGGVLVWHTALVDHATLCQAIALEAGLRAAERRAEERRQREQPDANCVTLPDGSCVSTLECMHGPEFPDGPESEGFEPGFEQRCGDVK